MIVVARVAGLATVQDLGRPGRMHEAIPAGGALVPELLAAANRRAGNADDAPAIEVLGRIVLRAEADVAIATDRDDVRSLRAGDELDIASEPLRVAYVAPRGGVAAPVVLGGRGALVCAGIGPILRAGHRLAVGGALGDRDRAIEQPIEPLDLAAPIRVIPGPDLDAFSADALAALTSARYRVSPASDRVGTRLVGPALARRGDYVEVSRPMVRGAIEVPRDGQPIVLGPEHPTTGGYPLLAVVAAADVGRLHAIRLGGELTFTIAR